MCDTLIQPDLPDKDKPQYVYKRVQKVGEGKYISPVMGESMKLNVWKKAPKRPELSSITYTGLVDMIKRPYSKYYYTNSSSYVSYHDGMWSCFKSKLDADNTDLVNNFAKIEGNKRISFPAIVVKCEVKGRVHKTRYINRDTFLCEYLKVVEELGATRFF